MRRDRLTFAMMIGVPIMQLVLFGFAINSDPKQLPTAVVAPTRALHAQPRARAREPEYFRIVRDAPTSAEAERLLATGEVQFVVTIPARTSRASCCAASGRCCWSRPTRPIRRPPATRSPRCSSWRRRRSHDDLTGPLAALQADAAAVRVRVHRALQPRGHHAIQHRAGPDGRDPHDDDGDDDRDRDDPRARARHDGEPARHAGRARSR